MARRTITLLAALLLLGFVVAGCGDDEEDGNGGTDTVTVTDEETVTDDETVTDTDTVTDGTDTGEGGGAAAPQSREQAAEQCRQSVDSAPQFSGEAEDELREFCDTIAEGDAEEIRESAREVCRTAIEDTVPEGTPGRQTALDACERNLRQQQ